MIVVQAMKQADRCVGLGTATLQDAPKTR